MKPDPIVEEVRKARHAHAAKFKFDINAIFKDLKEREKSCGHPVVSCPPRTYSTKSGS